MANTIGEKLTGFSDDDAAYEHTGHLTPSKPEWEDDVMEAFRESTPDRILDIVRSILSSHRRSLAEEVGKLKGQRVKRIQADRELNTEFDVAINAVLTIINRDLTQ